MILEILKKIKCYWAWLQLSKDLFTQVNRESQVIIKSLIKITIIILSITRVKFSKIKLLNKTYKNKMDQWVIPKIKLQVFKNNNKLKALHLEASKFNSQMIMEVVVLVSMLQIKNSNKILIIKVLGVKINQIYNNLFKTAVSLIKISKLEFKTQLLKMMELIMQSKDIHLTVREEQLMDLKLRTWKMY